MKWFRNGEKGFTLIELLVVIGILGALAAVVVPNVSRFAGRGVTEAQATELKAVQTAMDTAISDLGPVTIVAPVAPVKDFNIAGSVIDGGGGHMLYPDYLRFPSTGGSNITYTWNAAGKIQQCDGTGAGCSDTGGGSWK